MKRLIDETGLDSTDEQLANLFRAAAPFQPDPFRKRRVLVSLSRVESQRVPRFWFRPVVVAALLVSGTATAALGHRYVAQGGSLLRLGAPTASAAQSGPVEAKPGKRRPMARQAASSDAPADDSAAVEAPATTVEAPSAPHAAPRGTARVRPESSEDATHVVEAIQALRTERDPSRARELLNDYLKTHPNGVLSEDALALSIEAASAQHDPRAADYARRYLAKFPRGKYRDLANRAIQQQR
jgi:hypothetical protein